MLMYDKPMNENEYLEAKRQTRGQIPDESDRRNIITYIKMYDSKYPYPHPESIKAAMDEGLDETDRNVSSIHTKKETDGVKKALHLPQPFVLGLKLAYPNIFSDRVQYEWFCRNFRELVLINK